ncbi:AAA family ATPase [Cellulosimicrobium sp. Marseille-Q4280]|uniref:AAA family ATPase n=1 Tax=Cellulosimicrobium sp. Marseille-Q4280 TaxID=2937992 RepID=UPI00203CE720|nr:AAA family ATPase [Cellulosimicrobium sp. Marseille-Q4280]
MPLLGPDDDVVAHLGHAPRRITVAGVSGSGKTTLAGRLSQRLGVPHTDIDGLYHGPGWVPRPEFLDDVRALLAQDTFVTEWQYSTARPLILARVELLVWLDLPTSATMRQVLGRTVRRSVRREVLWNGNVEPPLWRSVLQPPEENIVRWAWVTRHKYRDLPERVARDAPHVALVRLRSRREVDRWVRRLPTRPVA